jgi:hypothetical protein
MVDRGTHMRMHPAADVILAIDVDGYGVLVDLHAGTFYPVNPTMARLWALLEQCSDLDTAVRVLASEYAMSVEQVRRDCLAQLRRNSLLTRRPNRGRIADTLTASGRSPSERIAVTAADELVSPAYRAAAWLGYLIGLLLQRVPYWLMLRIMQTIRRLRAQHPTPATTRQLVAAVRRIVWQMPGWAECHEISVPAYLAAAILGKAPHWRLEVTFAPVGLHAYLQDGDTAIDDVPQPRTRRIAVIQI